MSDSGQIGIEFLLGSEELATFTGSRQESILQSSSGLAILADLDLVIYKSSEVISILLINIGGYLQLGKYVYQFVGSCFRVIDSSLNIILLTLNIIGFQIIDGIIYSFECATRQVEEFIQIDVGCTELVACLFNVFLNFFKIGSEFVDSLDRFNECIKFFQSVLESLNLSSIFSVSGIEFGSSILIVNV